MSKIKLSELRPAGSELLEDSESFLNDLNDRDLENVVGGLFDNTIVSVASQNSISVGSVNTISDVGISQTNVTF